MEINVSWYRVSDMNAAKKFYGEVLGLKKTFDMEGWCEFSHAEGAASIGLNQLREGDDERGATVVLRVDDLTRVQKELSAKGVKFEPDQQAAIMLREVLGFSNQEAAAMLEVSEPVFRHRLSAARSKMIGSYAGLCQLINKTGVCWQCKGLQEFAGPGHNGQELVQIEVAPGVEVTPESLFDARLKIVREAGFPESTSRRMHDLFFEGLTGREEGRA